MEESWRTKWSMGRTRPISLAALATVIALAGLLGWAGLGQTQEPERVCQNLNNITVCGDEFSVPVTGSGEFAIIGNLTIGPKGKPPVVKVEDADDTFNFLDVPPQEYRAQFFHNND